MSTLSAQALCSVASVSLIKQFPQHCLQSFNFYIVDFCMCGTPWKKPTGVLAVGLNLEQMDAFRCLGAPRGLCRRTGKPHQILRGLNEAGIFRTKVAEGYPKKFCQLIARAYDNFWVQQIGDSFGHYVNGSS